MTLREVQLLRANVLAWKYLTIVANKATLLPGVLKRDGVLNVNSEISFVKESLLSRVPIPVPASNLCHSPYDSWAPTPCRDDALQQTGSQYLKQVVLLWMLVVSTESSCSYHL